MFLNLYHRRNLWIVPLRIALACTQLRRAATLVVFQLKSNHFDLCLRISRGHRMKIHEYQGKELLLKFGVAVCRDLVARSPEEAYHAAKELGIKAIVAKAQIHAGGR